MLDTQKNIRFRHDFHAGHYRPNWAGLSMYCVFSWY